MFVGVFYMNEHLFQNLVFLGEGVGTRGINPSFSRDVWPPAAKFRNSNSLFIQAVISF